MIGPDSIPSIVRKLNLKMVLPLTIAYHAVIKSFPTELEAMRKMADLYKGRVSFMVDTYDFNQGMKNAITVIQELKEKGIVVEGGITIDSGNLFDRSVRARKMLDDAGLHEVKITIASNLDEYKIKKLKEKGIPVDAFLVATEAATVSDSPKLEVVYKLSELQNDEKIKFCAKFSSGKESYPGRKQVFRTLENGKIKRDIIGLENEKPGQPLLIPVIKNGKQVYNFPSLDEIREYVKSQISLLPSENFAKLAVAQ